MRSPTHAANSPERTCCSTTSPVSGSGRRTTSAASSGSGWRPARRVSIAAVSKPSAAASAAHSSRIVAGSTSALAARVASIASAAAAAPWVPAWAIAASISERRFEKVDRTSAGTPAISIRPLPAGRQATPSCSVSSWAQGGAEHGAGGVLGPIQALGVECRPASVGAAGDVRDEDMGVQMGVAGAARAVSEPGRDEPGARQTSGAEVSRRAAGARPGCSTRDARNRPHAPATPTPCRRHGRGRQRRLTRPADHPGRRAPTPTSVPRT